MAGRKGYEGARRLRERRKDKRGGNAAHEVRFDQSAPDALGRWLEDYFAHLAVRNYSANTIRGRRQGLSSFIEWAQERGLTRAGEITRPILESYQRWLWRSRKANGNRLSVSHQRNRLSALKDWFRWMVRQNILPANPASELEMPRPEKRLPVEALSLAQIEAVLQVPDLADPLGVRDRAMLEVFYSSGIRRGDLCRLEVTDINPERRTLFVRQGKGHKDRVVPIGERALAWVERYLAEVRPRLVVDTRERALFLTGYGEAFNPQVVSHMASQFIKKADIGRKGSCHLLRHTCGTHLLEGGADIRFIQRILGHEKLETTAIYTEVSIVQLQEVHARCHPAERKKGLSQGNAPE